MEFEAVNTSTFIPILKLRMSCFLKSFCIFFKFAWYCTQLHEPPHIMVLPTTLFNLITDSPLNSKFKYVLQFRSLLFRLMVLFTCFSNGSGHKKGDNVLLVFTGFSLFESWWMIKASVCGSVGALAHCAPPLRTTGHELSLHHLHSGQGWRTIMAYRQKLCLKWTKQNERVLSVSAPIKQRDPHQPWYWWTAVLSAFMCILWTSDKLTQL